MHRVRQGNVRPVARASSCIRGHESERVWCVHVCVYVCVCLSFGTTPPPLPSAFSAETCTDELFVLVVVVLVVNNTCTPSHLTPPPLPSSDFCIHTHHQLSHVAVDGCARHLSSEQWDLLLCRVVEWMQVDAADAYTAALAAAATRACTAIAQLMTRLQQVSLCPVTCLHTLAPETFHVLLMSCSCLAHVLLMSCSSLVHFNLLNLLHLLILLCPRQAGSVAPNLSPVLAKLLPEWRQFFVPQVAIAVLSALQQCGDIV